MIYNLRSSVSFGTRTIQWSASHSEIDECLFGIWYSSETPVDTNRTPDATVWYSASMTEYQTSFAQNAPAWVAVAAMRLDEENQIGKVPQGNQGIAPPDDGRCGHGGPAQGQEEERNADGRYRDEKPFRIAILRLKAAVLQAQAACGETAATPD